MFNPYEAPKILAKEVAEADRKINEKVRRQFDGYTRNSTGEKCTAFDIYRELGMLDEVAPGSWEETTLVCMMENQRCIQECAWADNRTIQECCR